MIHLHAYSPAHKLGAEAECVHGWREALESVLLMMNTATGLSITDYRYRMVSVEVAPDWKVHTSEREFVITDPKAYESFVDYVAATVMKVTSESVLKANNDKTTTRPSAA